MEAAVDDFAHAPDERSDPVGGEVAGQRQPQKNC